MTVVIAVNFSRTSNKHRQFIIYIIKIFFEALTLGSEKKLYLSNHKKYAV